MGFTVPSGGLSLWCELPEGLDATRVALAAEDEGLLVAAGPRFSVAGGLGSRLRLPYVLPPEAMTDAVVRLARAVAAVRADAVAPGGAARRRAERGRAGRASRPLVA